MPRVSAMASATGFIKGANIVMLALYLLNTEAPSLDALKAVIPRLIKKKELVDVNLKLIEQAEAFNAG